MPVIKEKFLIVDDDLNILLSFKRQLRGKVNLTTANSGDEALELIKNEGPFAVIISDMRMPKMDGAVLLTKVKEYSPETIRIILTGQADMTSAIDDKNAIHNGSSH